ncbi:response regulator [Methanoculleus sp. Wushi-C6]|uniref:Response regulator n=1 Tax=Methanoculleus caldifontis TaxID=2651577 RepID=A0ABU3X2F3_9EURY|nr:response regulator [Methanoculleus sp. Wushi-C6]MDV2482227.1 response regulator [Methanoculleus sp. Wushi-C6]
MARILIADDLQPNRYLLESTLKGYGFEVTVTQNGAEALDAARSNPPDLIITDILMPVMDGFELCRRWKADERLRSVPFIFYTATYTDRKDELFARSLGAERFIVKPQRPEELVQAVREVLEENRKSLSTREPAVDETEILRQYSEVLFRKLEKKVAQLEADIAERRKIEAALSESEKFLNAIVENLPVMLSVRDARDLQLVRLNRAGEDLLGYAREEVYGKTDRDLFPKIMADRYIGTDRNVLRERHILEIPRETIRTKKNGERILHTRKIPICDEEGEPKYLLEISEDITEQVAVEEALNRATRKLSLLNGITFDEIQSAVFSLSGYLQLEKESGTDAQREQYREKQAAIVQILQNSLDFSRNYQNLGLKPPAWQNVMHAFLYAISHLCMLEMSRDLRVEGLEIYADPLLEKVFFALVENVVRHGEKATRISLEHHETDDGLILIFEDDGSGIPVHMKEKIFERRCKDKPGMGLFLAREILSITGITIRETGESMKGARFEMLVPRGAYRFVGNAE